MKAVNLVTPEHEHEFEAANGLPEALPRGETLIWQGSPEPWLLARQALHLDKILVYFGILLAWRGLSSWYDGVTLPQTLLAMAGMLPLIALAVGLLIVLAFLMARTSVYSITNRRVVMRIGVVLSITFNFPFSSITAANLRQRQQRSGDIALTLAGETSIAYLHLWPHARPWQLKRTQPMMRALAQADEVAQKLVQAMQQTQDQTVTAQTGALPLRAVFENNAAPAQRQVDRGNVALRTA